MTTSIPPSSVSPSPPRARPRARHACARRPRAPAICAALLCAAHLCAGASSARKPRTPRAASSPSNAQILAPSAATVPDALPADKTIYRCGNAYSPRACGDARPLAVADARSDAQRRQADDLAARDKRLASWYEAGRREREPAASAPVRGRPASAVPQCTSTIMMTCVPRKPRTRIVLPAPTGGGSAGKTR